MLATSSTVLKGNESFEEAFASIPEKKVKQRKLYTEDKEFSGYIQTFNDDSWGSATKVVNRKGDYVFPSTESKSKLKDVKPLYDIFTTPTHAGSNGKNSWLVGDIANCEIMNEQYNVQGLIISSIFDPLPKYYISFERLVCENQFGSLGTGNSSMYIGMNKLLYVQTAKESLERIIFEEVEKRKEQATKVYDKLLSIKLSKNKAIEMFKKLTIDKVAKDSERYTEEEAHLQRYIDIYNCEDNQNFKGTFFGFVNTCTNINTREKTNPLDVVKPVLSPAIIDRPCNFEYLCRDVLVRA